LWSVRPTGAAPATAADEVVDQGLAFDVETLLNRRRALRFLGLGAAGAVLAACGTGSSGSSTTTTTSAAAAASG
jgi:hypothetical protein